jgi:hypothetical protein
MTACKRLTSPSARSRALLTSDHAEEEVKRLQVIITSLQNDGDAKSEEVRETKEQALHFFFRMVASLSGLFALSIGIILQ